MSESRISRGTIGAWWGAAGNAVLAAGKALVGWWTDSEALLWDATRSVAEASGCVAVLLGLNALGRGAFSGITRGSGGFRAAAVAASMLPLFVGWEIVYGSIRSFGRADDHLAAWPAALAVLLAAAVKEVLARRIPDSDVDGRSVARDRIASVVVLAGVGLASVATQAGLETLAFSEAVAGMALGALALWCGFGAVSGAVRAAAGIPADGARTTALKEAAGLVPGVLGVSFSEVRQYGKYAIVRLRIAVDPCLTVREAHAIAQAVRTLLLARFPDMAAVEVAVCPHVQSFTGSPVSAEGAEDGLTSPDYAALSPSCRRPTLH